MVNFNGMELSFEDAAAMAGISLLHGTPEQRQAARGELTESIIAALDGAGLAELIDISGLTTARWMDVLGISKSSLAKYKAGDQRIPVKVTQRAIELAVIGSLLSVGKLTLTDIARIGIYRRAELEASGDLETARAPKAGEEAAARKELDKAKKRLAK